MKKLKTASVILAISLSSPFCSSLPFFEKLAYAQDHSARIYSPNTDPLLPNQRIRTIATRAFYSSSSNESRLRYLFDHLKSSNPHGLRSIPLVNFPSTSAQTFQFGGDCSDLTLAFLSAVRYMNRLGARFSYGARIYQTRENTTNLHMVALVSYGAHTSVIDLTSNTFGTVATTCYSTYLSYPLSRNNDSPSAIYHAEWGDYFRINRASDPSYTTRAIEAYERSLELYPDDSFVHNNLAFLYDLVGNSHLRDLHATLGRELRSR